MFVLHEVIAIVEFDTGLLHSEGRRTEAGRKKMRGIVNEFHSSF